MLAGGFPSDASLPAFELAALTLPQEVPVSLPSSLVRQRPDIRASEALWHRASAEVGVATANLYPQITLSGAFGSQTTQFRQPARRTLRVEHRRRAAAAVVPRRAAARRSAARPSPRTTRPGAQYRETVLKAFQEVADTLRALETTRGRCRRRRRPSALASATLDLTRRQLQLGAVNYLALLVVQRQYELARIALVQAQAARYADTAALFQALGGGWWNRPSAATGSTE